MFLSIIVKLPVPNLSILLVIREKATVSDGPWSATEVNSTKKRKNVIVSTRKRDFHNISCIFSYSWCNNYSSKAIVFFGRRCENKIICFSLKDFRQVSLPRVSHTGVNERFSAGSKLITKRLCMYSRH